MSADPNNVTRGHASRRARSSRGKQAPRLRIVAPVEAVKADPMAWTYALALADGDARRLDIQPDGAVIVRNNRVR